MADEEHLKILKQGVAQWNKWRFWNTITPDLSGADLSGADLTGADLSGADLSGANLSGAYLIDADLSGAYLRGADLYRATLLHANLSGANLSGADLTLADLTLADLRGANLSPANLSRAKLQCANLTSADLTDADLSCTSLVETDFTNATITGCRTYGASAWNVTLVGTVQQNLVITKEGEHVVTVDDLEVGQFVYLLLNRKKIRNVLDTMTSKAVLLLGRFTPDRKAVLDAMADKLRTCNLLPIIFDFERSTNRDFTETIKTLAGLSLFVIVDLTKPKSAPQEVTATVPDYQIPFVPILQEGEEPYSMFGDLKKYDWVLPLLKYRTKEELLANFKEVVLDRAWKKHVELQRKKNEELQMISIDEMIKQKE
jgi:hypothetical protein